MQIFNYDLEMSHTLSQDDHGNCAYISTYIALFHLYVMNKFKTDFKFFNKDTTALLNEHLDSNDKTGKFDFKTENVENSKFKNENIYNDEVKTIHSTKFLILLDKMRHKMNRVISKYYNNGVKTEYKNFQHMITATMRKRYLTDDNTISVDRPIKKKDTTK